MELAESLAESLTDRLDDLTFTDLDEDKVAELLRDAVAQWGTERGWRVYRRARSVFRLPPPYQDRHSIVDIACARPDGPPIVVEVDKTDRKRSIEKLLAEAAAGRVALWVRWGKGPFTTPPEPITLVEFAVTSQKGLHSRIPHKKPPAHSEVDLRAGDQSGLF